MPGLLTWCWRKWNSTSYMVGKHSANTALSFVANDAQGPEFDVQNEMESN